MGRPRILVADDEPHARSALRRRLKTMGYDVIEAGDGVEVLRECARGWIDAVILDHGMPCGDGRSIARVLRHETDVPIVFLSGYDREDFRSIVAELPDVYFLSKPVDEQRLANLLASLTATKGVDRRSLVPSTGR